MKLNIAIQKSGRLHDQTIQLLNEVGLKVENVEDQLKVEVRNFEANVFFLRNSDIPKYIEDGIADMAIIGENTILEKKADIRILDKLGFSKCRLSIAVPKDTDYHSIKDLEGMRIATSYPNSLKKYLTQRGISAQIHLISGSVEIAPNIGLADAICDIVSSGSTLFRNGLVEKEVVLKSEACVAVNNHLNQKKWALLDQLLFRIRAVLKGRQHKYILMNVPNDSIQRVSEILPVLKSPTVLPLVKKGWSSLHSVISEEDFWKVINELKQAGAEGILVVPIQKMVV